MKLSNFLKFSASRPVWNDSPIFCFLKISPGWAMQAAPIFSPGCTLSLLDVSSQCPHMSYHVLLIPFLCSCLVHSDCAWLQLRKEIARAQLPGVHFDAFGECGWSGQSGWSGVCGSNSWRPLPHQNLVWDRRRRPRKDSDDRCDHDFGNLEESLWWLWVLNQAISCSCHCHIE